MRLRRLILIGLGPLLLSGCRDREISSYRVPKEPPPRVAEAPAAPAPSGRTLAWSPPDHWQNQGTTQMRRGSYTIVGEAGATADLSIIAFPGDAGGLLENMNRWRGQISLTPLTRPELEAQLQHLDVGPLHIDVVDFTGTAGGSPTRILGAVLSYGGESWFFKLMGPDALVAAEKPAFLTFIQTLRES